MIRGTTTDDLIRAKVARILHNTDLALNKGEGAGVEEGMKFAILSDAGEDIRDPDTGEILDSIRLPRLWSRSSTSLRARPSDVPVAPTAR